MTRPPGEAPGDLSGPAAPSGRPDVIVEFLFDRGVLFVAVRNIGDRPAVRVSVRFEPPLPAPGGGRDLSEQALFRSIEFLGPGREIATLLDRSDAFFHREPVTRISAEVRYEDREGHRYQETIPHDLEIFRDIVFLADDARSEPVPPNNEE